MYELFEAIVKTSPQNIAFILSNKEKLSYAEAANVVELWTRFLLSYGVKQGDLVAILTREEDMYVFFHLALDRLNATILPLDTDTPSGELTQLQNVEKFFIDEVLISVEIYHDSITIPIKTNGIYPPDNVVLFSDSLPIIVRNPDIDNYVIASSGVTDRKKWIPIASNGLPYWAELIKESLKLSYPYKVLRTRSPAYDAAIFECICALAGGGTLVFISQSNRLNLHSIVEHCEQENITVLIMIASQLSMPNQKEIMQRMVNSGLKHLLVTGDECPLGLKKLVETMEPPLKLWNCYGPTEATFGMSMLCVNGLPLFEKNGKQIVPIGMPNKDLVKAHIIADRLYIQSPFLSRGYKNDPVRTAENFPEILVDGNLLRAFDTKDKFKKQNGYLIYKGRINEKAHINIAGVKIEAVDIRRDLETYNRQFELPVIQIYVVIKKWRNKLKPVAYLVIHNADFDKQRFRDFVNKTLRKSRIPIFIKLDKFPRLLVSQKIDEQSLINRNDLPQEYLFQREYGLTTETEAASSSSNSGHAVDLLWCEILELDRADPKQEFLLCGGDSFQLNHLFFKIKETINPDYRFETLLRLPSITLENVRRSIESPQIINYSIALIKPLVTIEPDKINYFFLPPLLGEGYFTYRQFAAIFQRSYNVNIFGLSDPAMLDPRFLAKSLDEAAERYIQAIKTIQPKGPYYLLGFSYGGTLAYYVAKQLLATGEQIHSVHLVDCFPAYLYQTLPFVIHARLVQKALSFIRTVLQTPFYNEQITKITYSQSYQDLNHEQQIRVGFDTLESKLTKSHSKALIAVARNHLLLAIDSAKQPKLPIQAFLYFSKQEQCLLQAIDHVPNISKHSMTYQYSYWNKWFESIVLGTHNRADIKHIELLTAQPGEHNKSADIFFQSHRARPYNAWCPSADIVPFYLKETNQKGDSLINFFAIDAKLLAFFKEKFKEHKLNVHTWPMLEQLSPMIDKEDICTARYGLSVIIPNNKLFFVELSYRNKIKHCTFDRSNYLWWNDQLLASQLQQYFPSFDITLNLQKSNGHRLLSLTFQCQGDSNILLNKLLEETGLRPDSQYSEPDKRAYHLTISKQPNIMSNELTRRNESDPILNAPDNSHCPDDILIRYYMPLLHSIIFWITPFSKKIIENMIKNPNPIDRFQFVKSNQNLAKDFQTTLSKSKDKFLSTKDNPYRFTLRSEQKKSKKSQYCNADSNLELSQTTTAAIAFKRLYQDLKDINVTRLNFRNDLAIIPSIQWEEINDLAQQIHSGELKALSTNEVIDIIDRLTAYSSHLQQNYLLINVPAQNLDSNPARLQQIALYWLEAAYKLIKSSIPDIDTHFFEQHPTNFLSLPAPLLTSVSLMLYYLAMAKRHNPATSHIEINVLNRICTSIANHLFRQVVINPEINSSHSFTKLMIFNLRQSGKQDEARYIQAEQIVLHQISLALENKNNIKIIKYLTLLSDINREKFDLSRNRADLDTSIYQAKRALRWLRDNSVDCSNGVICSHRAYIDAKIALIKVLIITGETQQAEAIAKSIVSAAEKRSIFGVTSEQLQLARAILPIESDSSSLCAIL